MTVLVGVPAAVAVLLLGLLAITPLIDAHRRRALRRIVADVCRVFQAHEIDYWCDFGTLLGFHREGDIIASDKDADLCVLASEAPRVLALAPVLQGRGYWLTDRGGRARKLIRIHDRRTWYYVDVYTYVEDGAILRSVFASPQEDVPAVLVSPRVDAPFAGATVRVPADVPALLRHRYGPGFAVPRRGDKGRARRYSRLRSLGEDLVDNCVGIRSLLRAAVMASDRHH